MPNTASEPARRLAGNAEAVCSHYLSIKLDDPSVPAPICATLVEGEDDNHSLIWSRCNDG